MEYRGYDSAGIAILNGEMNIYKKEGKVADLIKHTRSLNTKGNLGMGHTRWATHGKPNDTNAHPHTSQSGRLAIIHNGIIENYALIKEALSKEGHTFESETDTEVLIHLIETILDKGNVPLEEAVRLALTQVVGAYAIVVMDNQNPDILVAARKASPLVIGLGEDEYFIASDPMPLASHTKQVIYLNDEEIAVVRKGEGVIIKTLDDERVQNPIIEKIELNIQDAEKGDYEHFMLKEIFEQPKTIADAMRGRISATEGWVRVGGIENNQKRISAAQRIIIVACGTSWHAGLIGEYLFEELARLPVEVEYASEFRYRNPLISEKDVILALSQSGETADTLAALQAAQKRSAITYGIVNKVGSSIARLTDSGSYIHAGPEIGVASTKAFTGQVSLLTLMALSIGYQRDAIPRPYFIQLLQELERIPDKVARVLENEDKIKYIATELQNATNALYLGRGYNFPIALEGALKLKEISYIHAEGYPAAEMKHGPIALIDENMPVIVIATNKSAYDKIVSNVQEVKARKGIVISVVTEGDKEIAALSDYIIEIPDTDEPFTPLLSCIPLQLLSYHIARLRGCDVDQPRNLAKSVTVE